MQRAFALILIVGLAAGVGWGGYRIAREVWLTRRFQEAETALVEQDFARALQELETCLKARPGWPLARFRAARAARRGGDLDKAEMYLAQCEEARSPHVPAEVDLELERNCLRAQQGDIAEVAQFLKARSKEKGFTGQLALEALSQGHFVLRDGDTARYLDQLLQEAPTNLRGNLIRAELSLQKDDLEGAIRDGRLALETWPTAFQPRWVVASALQHEGKIREAIKEFQTLASAYPGRPEGLAGLALCRAELHQFDEAAKLYDLVLAKHPTFLTALIERGRVALRQGKAAEAEPFLRRALAVNDKDFDANDTLVKVLEKQEKTEEATAQRQHLNDLQVARGLVERERIAFQSGENSLEGTLAIAEKLLRVGRDDEAILWYLSALQRDPTHPQTRLALADYYERDGEPHRAAYQRKLAARYP